MSIEMTISENIFIWMSMLFKIIPLLKSQSKRLTLDKANNIYVFIDTKKRNRTTLRDAVAKAAYGQELYRSTCERTKGEKKASYHMCKWNFPC